MSAKKWALPAWTGPDSPQTPVPVNEPPQFPQYRTLPIAACPECLGDCTYEGVDGWHCAACKQMWTHAQVAYFEEGERSDD